MSGASLLIQGCPGIHRARHGLGQADQKGGASKEAAAALAGDGAGETLPPLRSLLEDRRLVQWWTQVGQRAATVPTTAVDAAGVITSSNRCGVVLLRLRLHGAELRLRLRQPPFAGSFLPWAWRDGGRSGAGIGAVARDPRGGQQLSCVASQQATVSQDDYDEPLPAGTAVLAGAVPLASSMSQLGKRSDRSYYELGRCRSGWTFIRWGTRLRPACCTVG
jgi:hypothetical protein